MFEQFRKLVLRHKSIIPINYKVTRNIFIKNSLIFAYQG